MGWESVSAITGILSLVITIAVEWRHLKPLLSKVQNTVSRILLGAVIVGISSAIVAAIIGAIIGAILHATGGYITIEYPQGNIVAQANGETDNAITGGIAGMLCGCMPGAFLGAFVGFVTPFLKKKS